MRDPLSDARIPWMLRLPATNFSEKTVKLNERAAIRFVETIRGVSPHAPVPGWARDESSRFGEDLVGGWLLENGGRVEGLRKGVIVPIPEGGASSQRRTDWLLGRRIIVEVKTYMGSVSKGDGLKNTRQFEDYVLWRDQVPDKRAVVMARVAWNGNLRIEQLFREDLRHFRIPVVFFQWKKVKV